MACLNDELRQKYPNTYEALYMSVSGTTITNTYAGMLTELSRLMGATALPLNRRLRPISRIDKIKQAPAVLIERIEFRAYDCKESAGTGQDTNVYNEIIGTRTDNEIMPQSYFQNAELSVNWQPNFFRPVFFVNHVDLLGLTDSEDNTIADVAIGDVIPACYTLMQEVGHLQTVMINAALAQWIPLQAKYQNYPLIAKIVFWWSDRDYQR